MERTRDQQFGVLGRVVRRPPPYLRLVARQRGFAWTRPLAPEDLERYRAEREALLARFDDLPTTEQLRVLAAERQLAEAALQEETHHGPAQDPARGPRPA